MRWILMTQSHPDTTIGYPVRRIFVAGRGRPALHYSANS